MAQLAQLPLGTGTGGDRRSPAARVARGRSHRPPCSRCGSDGGSGCATGSAWPERSRTFPQSPAHICRTWHLRGLCVSGRSSGPPTRTASRTRGRGSALLIPPGAGERQQEPGPAGLRREERRLPDKPGLLGGRGHCRGAADGPPWRRARDGCTCRCLSDSSGLGPHVDRPSGAVRVRGHTPRVERTFGQYGSAAPTCPKPTRIGGIAGLATPRCAPSRPTTSPPQTGLELARIEVWWHDMPVDLLLA